MTVFNSKLYIAWREFNTTASQIRIALYDGAASSFQFVEHSPVTTADGINYDPAKNASRPQLTVLGTNLYAIWQEFGDTVEQIRVAMYNNDDQNPSWTFVDGGGTNGINFDVTKVADLPHLTVFNSKLYAAWEEFNGSSLQVRVKVYQGGGLWLSVDGNGILGGAPELTAFNSKLYLIWQEFNGTATQVRMSVFNGNDATPTWSSIDGVIKIPNGTSSCALSGNCPIFSGGGISGPSGIAVDPSDNVWVANSNNNSVTKITSGSTSDCSSGCTNFSGGGISGPIKIILDLSGNVWIVNSNNSLTQIPAGATSCSSCINFTGSQINGPLNVIADLSGNIWVINSSNSLTRIPAGATSCSSCTNFTGSQINGPTAIALDNSGNIWVANGGDNSVTKIPNGAIDCSGCLNYSGGIISGPTGIVVDSLGSIWVSNWANNSVTEIQNGAPIDCSSGCRNFNGGGISGPKDIAADPSNNIWIINSNFSISKIITGSTSCSSPNNCVNFTGNGLSVPAATTSDFSSNFWIANSDNTIITKIPVGSISCSLNCVSFSTGGTHQSGMTIDSLGNVWISTRGLIGYNGINKNPSKNGSSPHLAELGARLYAAWEESNEISTQIRIALYNGNDSAPSWKFLDGDGVNGLNYDSSKFALNGNLISFGSNLYAAWQENNGIATQIRMAMYNGNESSPLWSFVDGESAFGINFDTGKSADHPQMTVYNSKLYISWDEFHITSQIRVAAGQ